MTLKNTMDDYSLITRKIVLPAHLNHHDTLFAPQMAYWHVEASFLCMCRIVKNPSQVYCLKVMDFLMTKPIQPGEMVELRCQLVKVGKTSAIIYTDVVSLSTGETAAHGGVKFVTAENGQSIVHGIELPDTDDPVILALRESFADL